jgi:hypothetical protein
VAKKEKIVITGKMIEIKGDLARHKIVRKVVDTFIKTEYRKKGKGVKFRYPVEDLPDGHVLYIVRPGHKKNFDFKVDVLANYGLGEGSHEKIAWDLRKRSRGNPKKFKKLWQAMCKVYHCKENDVDILLREGRGLTRPFKNGANPELLLKVIKWLFIMEDIVYWDNEGRAFLFNFFSYVVSEKSKERIREALSGVKNPDGLRSFMRKSGIEWVPYGG